ILGKLHTGLNDPDYNFVIRSSRPKDMLNEYCHWYIALIPRVTKRAGFEIGSGMYINTAVPEERAKFLRNIKAKP
ncbi:MAG: galactose-1-phosphate uridylyltransferase, partial [Deltaproteobacteria bacterium]|nr:galactose-1-phosphate uridylyltransferase [Deltaproteobacteria bacterium]